MHACSVATFRMLSFVAVVVMVAWTAFGLPAATTVAAPEEQAGALSLIYLEAEKPGTNEIWEIPLDGREKRLAGGLAPGAVPLDLRGHLLAMASRNQLVMFDLRGQAGKQATVAPGSRVGSAYIAENGGVYFTSRVGCGAPEVKTQLSRLDMATGERTDIAVWDEPGAEILWHSQAANEIIVTPRGCDPGVWEIRRHDAGTGVEKSLTKVEGCGWAAVSPTGMQALVTNVICGMEGTPPLYAYDLQGAGRRDVRFEKDGPSQHPPVYAPDGKRVALGVTQGDTRAGLTEVEKAKSGGIWLPDTASLAQTKLWQDEGLESWAIDWSPDGSKLLVASVEAQGRCRYFTIVVETGEVVPVEGINGCGANGTMVGFAALP